MRLNVADSHEVLAMRALSPRQTLLDVAHALSQSLQSVPLSRALVAHNLG